MLEADKQDWTDDTEFEDMKNGYVVQWKMLFEMANMGPLDMPLTQSVLSDPYHPITKHLLYLYTMESFIYSTLNRSSRDQIKEQLDYYGPYAAALGYILYFAN